MLNYHLNKNIFAIQTIPRLVRVVNDFDSSENAITQPNNTFENKVITRMSTMVFGEDDNMSLNTAFIFSSKVYNQYSSLSGNCDEITGVENIGNNVNGFQPADNPPTCCHILEGLSAG
jgi:hypothetical protein